MNRLSVVAACLLLAACSAQPQPPLASDRVRVTLDADVGSLVRAYRLDGVPERSLRFDDFTPGQHELQARFEFEVSTGGSVQGVLNSGRRTCIMAVKHNFMPGQHYRFELARRGWRPAGWLYDDHSDEPLARASEVRCGPGV